MSDELASGPEMGTDASVARASDFTLLDDAEFAKEMGLDSPPGEESQEPDEQVHDLGNADGDEEEPDESDQDADEEAEGDEVAGHKKDEKEEEQKPAERRLATPFTLAQDGEEVEIPTDLMVKFERHGKEVELPLDKVVRLAKDGFHNRELQAQADRVPALEEDLQTLEERSIQLAETVKRLLTDEEYFQQTQEKYAAATTPEARATRAEQALEAERQERQALEARQHFSVFVRDEVQGALEEALEAAPDVDPNEVTDWVTREIRLFQPTRNAPPPRSAFREILRVVREEVIPRIAREQTRAAEVREARELKAKQGVITQKTKRAKALAAGAIRPAGKGGGAPKPKSTREIVSMDDATADIIDGLFK